MELKSQIIGADQIDAILRQLPATVARRVAGNALRSGARIIRDKAKQNVPVQTGDLKKAIRVLTGRGRNAENRIVHVGVFGKESPLAHIVEFGTTPVRKAKKAGGYMYFVIDGKLMRKKEVRGVKARPFLRPAADAMAREVIDAIGAEIAASIEREGARARTRLAK